VDRYEWSIHQRAALVDRARHQLLAGTALAGDQHRALVLGDGLHPPVDVAHGRAHADQLAEALRAAKLIAEPLVLAPQRLEAQHTLEREQDLLRTSVLDE